MGPPKRNPKNIVGTNIIEYEDPGRYIRIILLLHSWSSLFGVPSKAP